MSIVPPAAPAAAAATQGAGTLSELIARQAALTPSAIAVSGESERLDYAGLDRRANQLGRYLAELGVGPESLVAVNLDRGVDLVVALLGVWRAGAAYLPLDPTHPAERRRRLLAGSGAAVLLTRDALRDEATPCRVVCLDTDRARIAACPDTPAVPSPDPDSLAYAIYTSGSTGRPKGVLITHRGIGNRVTWTVREPRPGPRRPGAAEDLAQFRRGGLGVLRPAGQRRHRGARPARAPNRDPAALVAAVAGTRITVLQGVPSVLRLLVDQPGWADCTRLRLVFSAGEPLHADLCQRLTVTPDVRVWNTYGPTECAIDVTAHPVDPAQPAGPVPIGRPIANIRVLVLDAGRRAGAGRRGGRALHRRGRRGPRLPGPAGPHRRPVRAGRVRPARRAPLPHRRPGPVARRTEPGVPRPARPPGQGQRGTDRAGRGRGGARRPPGRPRRRWWSAHTDPAVASSSPRTSPVARSLDPAALRAFCVGRLPEALVPGRVPAGGRVPAHHQRQDRPVGPAGDRPSRPRRRSGPPRTAAEQTVAAIWQDLLGVDEVGVDDDFFQLGGSSLVTLALDEPAQRGGRRGDAARPAHPRHRGRAGPAGGGGHPGGSDRCCPWDATGRAGAALRRPAPALDARPARPAQQGVGRPRHLRLPAAIHPDHVRAALHALEARHEPLRTRYLVVDGVARQQVVPPGAVDLEVRDVSHGGLAELITDQLGRGFDLHTGPLWRAGLAVAAGRDHLLVLAVHHIASDAGSADVLERDLRELCDAAVQGRPADLANLRVQYADYAVWQQRHLTDDVVGRELAYWRETLAGHAPAGVAPRPSASGPAGRAGQVLGFTVAAEVAGRLTSSAGAARPSPFMTLLTGFATLLAALHRAVGPRRSAPPPPGTGPPS